MQLYVYDHLLGGFSRFGLQRTAALPYGAARPVRLHDFLGSTKTETVWTDRRLLSAFCALAERFGAPVSVFGGFRRATPGRRVCASPRTAGLTLDVGHDLPPRERERLRRLAVKSGLFSTVLPEHIAPTWVSLALRTAPPAGPGCPFPALCPGEKDVCVFALQDALAVRGFPPDEGLTGCFDAATERSLRTFCKSMGMPYPGLVAAEVWRAL